MCTAGPFHPGVRASRVGPGEAKHWAVGIRSQTPFCPAPGARRWGVEDGIQYPGARAVLRHPRFSTLGSWVCLEFDGIESAGSHLG